MVEYRAIPRYPGYRVGDDGSVWSCWKWGGTGFAHWRRLKLGVQKTGYLYVNLYKDKKPYTLLVHRLVLEAFVGPCPEGKECRHFPDSNRQNNSLNNLSWDTHKVNCEDTVKAGRSQRGGAAAKLRPKDVRQARKWLDKGIAQAEVARRLGVTDGTISFIRRGITWSWLK